MRKYLKYSGLCALALTIAAFILLMVTRGVVYHGDNSYHWYSATAIIFGKGQAALTGSGISLVIDWEGDLAWNALLAWIFILVAFVTLLVVVGNTYLKVKVLEKLSGLLTLVAAGLLIVAGVFLFFTVGVFNPGDGWTLSAGWLIGAILALAGGCIAALPAVLAFVKK